MTPLRAFVCAVLSILASVATVFLWNLDEELTKYGRSCWPPPPDWWSGQLYLVAAASPGALRPRSFSGTGDGTRVRN